MSRITLFNLGTYFILWFCVADAVFTLSNIQENSYNPSNENATNYRYYEKRFKLLENILQLAFRKKNVLRQNVNVVDILPNDALEGVYSECIFGLSFSCLQKKLIAFLYKLDKVKYINLVGESVAVVRKHDIQSDTTSLAKIADYVNQAYLKEIIDNLIEQFFDNHFIRVKVPEYFDNPGENDVDGTYLDIDFGSKESLSSAREGRKKKGKSKHLKKIMMLLGLMTCVKLTLMGPLVLGLLGLKAMKALIFAVMSLTISKMMMLSKVNLSSLISSGHDSWSSSGHGGWDRNIQEVPPSPPTSALPYYIEPPGNFKS